MEDLAQVLGFTLMIAAPCVVTVQLLQLSHAWVQKQIKLMRNGTTKPATVTK